MHFAWLKFVHNISLAPLGEIELLSGGVMDILRGNLYSRV